MRRLIADVLIFLCFVAKGFLSFAANEGGVLDRDQRLKQDFNDGLMASTVNNQRELESSNACKPQWYKDSQCDIVNCKAVCDWDGGDCTEAQCAAYFSLNANANSSSRPNSEGSNLSSSQSSGSQDDYYDDDTYAPVTPPTTEFNSDRKPTSGYSHISGQSSGNQDDYYDDGTPVPSPINDDYYVDDAAPISAPPKATVPPPTMAPVLPPTMAPVPPPTMAPVPPPTIAPVSQQVSGLVLNKALCRSKGGKPRFIDDGKCDKFNRIPECNYDGGDCPYARCRGAGGKPKHINDGTCDDFNNRPECNYDGNDCRSSSQPNETPPPPKETTSTGSSGGNNQASIRCKNAGGKPELINDGTCDKVNNILECNHDGKDCHFTFPAKENLPASDLAPPSDSSSGSSGGDVGQYWTDLHNDVRRHYQPMYGYDFVNMVWSDELAKSSQGYADVLASSPCDQYDHDKSNPYGENLAVMWESNDPSGEKSRIKRVMNAWTYEEEIKPSTRPYQEGAGHWTQVIWRATKYVGCAHTYRSSEGCHVYVCRYVTPGNCARSDNNWLSDTMQASTRCEPQCPPNEGCFWKQTS